jgi:hypothetical protein
VSAWTRPAFDKASAQLTTINSSEFEPLLPRLDAIKVQRDAHMKDEVQVEARVMRLMERYSEQVSQRYFDAFTTHIVFISFSSQGRCHVKTIHPMGSGIKPDRRCLDSFGKVTPIVAGGQNSNNQLYYYHYRKEPMQGYCYMNVGWKWGLVDVGDE